MAAVEEEPKEDGEEFEDLAAMLERLGLSEYKTTFDQERIDVESFVRKTHIYLFHVECIHFEIFGVHIHMCISGVFSFCFGYKGRLLSKKWQVLARSLI